MPRFGFKSALADKEDKWVIEVPQNADPNEDQFAKISHDKKERVAKNELQRLRNIARAKHGKVPRTGLPTTDKASSKQVTIDISLLN